MNKFNIDEELFYTKIDFRNVKEFKPILVRVKKIEKIDNNQIIYTVKFISSIGWSASDRLDRNEKQLSEGCLNRSLDVLKAIHDKAIGKK